tara:strand:+ start:7263 stop:7712 length:450 start_codon:yes stop_codon:yes gene_type:complete
MSKIKFKDILKEAAWDHVSGQALPTLDDVQKAYNAKKHLQEGLSSSDIKKATEAIKKYVKKLGKKADGEIEVVAGKLAKILGWDERKRRELESYLYKLNNGDDTIIFGESKLTEGDNDTYTWKQINSAFMAQGTPPKLILRFLSILKKQ